MCNHTPRGGRGVKNRGATRTPSPVLGLLFQHIAFWQGMGFVMLICVVWVNAVLDLPNLMAGTPPSSVNWIGASILTAGILIIAFITEAHIYLLQHQILRGIIVVCSYCNKVKLEESQWEGMERYFADKTLAKFSHGVCPDCYDEIQADYALGDVDRASPEPEFHPKPVV